MTTENWQLLLAVLLLLTLGTCGTCYATHDISAALKAVSPDERQQECALVCAPARRPQLVGRVCRCADGKVTVLP